MKLMNGLLAGGAITAIAIASPALAQDSGADNQPALGTDQTRAQTPANTETGSPTIIVTAQRREEDLTDVPVAITVFDSETRDKIGIRTIQDFANFTPGMSFSTSLDRISLRGVGRLTNIIGSDPGVATYNDGFYTASSAEASKTPMFVERIEVLRGPQGTLYGRNSVGGALNVVSKRPDDYWNGELRLTVDQYGGIIPEGFVSGPVVGDLSTRISVQLGPKELDNFFEQTSGLTQDEGSLNRFLVEAQLQYDFTDDTQLWFKYSHAEWDDNYRSANLATPYATDQVAPAGALVPNAAFGYTVTNPGIDDPFQINTNTRSQQNLEDNHNFVVNFTAGLGGIAMKYVGGYSQYLYTAYSDLDYTSRTSVTTNVGAPFTGAYTYNPTYIQEYIEDKRYYSNEVTFSNADIGAFNWIVGLYQYHEEFFQPITWFQGGDGLDNLGQALPNPICITNVGTVDASCAPNPRRAFYAGSGDLTIDSYAAFGQADLELAEGLKATAGLRYSIDEKTGDETYRLVSYNPTAFVAACGGGCGPFTPAQDITRLLTGVPGSGPVARTLSDDWDGFSWRLGLDYEPNPDTLIFGSYARGLKAGGFNLGSFAENPVVDKETVDSFELGLKSRPFDFGSLNVTGFYYDYKNPQIPISVLRAGSSFSSTNFFNLPKAKSFGVEVETALFPTDWLELNANYSYLDATIEETSRDFDDPGTPSPALVSIEGNRLPQSSRHQVALSTLFDVPVGRSSLFLAASYVYRSDFYSSVFQTEQNRVPGYDRVDLRATWIDPSQTVTLIGFVRNAFDTLGYDGVAAATGGTSTGYGRIISYTPPRTFGAEVQVKF